MFCIRIQKEKLAATCTVETNEMLQLSDLNLYNKVTLKHLPFVFGFSLLSVAENWKCWVFCWEYFHTIDNKGLRRLFYLFPTKALLTAASLRCDVKFHGAFIVFQVILFQFVRERGKFAWSEKIALARRFGSATAMMTIKLFTYERIKFIL